MVHIFIINPYAGKQKFAEGLREKLSKMENLNYFVFNTRYAGYEDELVKRLCTIFEGEKLRFYCCGGSGTLRNVVNALGNHINKVEVAFFPCGHTNDYLKIFGEQEKKFFNIENLINGKVIDVDYIKSNHGIAINTCSGGIDTEYMDIYLKLGALKEIAFSLSNGLSFLKAIFLSKYTKYNVKMDGKEFENAYVEFIIGKGTTLGGILNFAKAGKPNDGQAHSILVSYRNLIGRINITLHMIKKDFDTYSEESEIGMCKELTIRRSDNKPFNMNFDGELENGTEFNISIVNKGLKMVVPREVKLEG